MVFYFTATGNCLYVAKNLDGELLSIPREKLGKTYKAEVIGVVSPIFGHDLPTNVQEFLRAATFKTDYFYLVMTYGFMHGGAGLRAEKLLRDSRTIPDYINTLKMVDNALPAFDIEEELKLEPSKKIDEHLAEIKKDIAERKKFIQQPDQANLDYHEKFLNASFKLDPENDFRAKGRELYTISDDCVGCGVCSKVCPRGCIKIIDRKARQNMKNCLACLACIHACKRKAIHFTFLEKNPNARYRNPHIKLAEIIAANNQTCKIRPAQEKDFAQILKLNAADVEMLSPLDEENLSRMAKLATLFQVAEIDGQVAAFQIIFRENVDYWSENYKWFCENYPSFLYVDRIVVDKNFRERGLGRKLYEEVFNFAKANDISTVAAEIDIAPKFNAASIAFHKKMDFHEVGTRLFKGKITVSLQIKNL